MKFLTAILAAIALVAAVAVPSAVAHNANPDFRSEIEPLPQDGITDGVQMSIAPGSDHVRLENKSGKTVTVIGEKGEPYLRILPNGEIQINVNSFSYKRDEAAEAADEAAEAHEAGADNQETSGGTVPDEHADGKKHEHADEAAPDESASDGGTVHVHADGTEHVHPAKPETTPVAGESGKGGPQWETVQDVEKYAYEWRDSRARYLGEGVPPQVTDQSKETLVNNYVIPLDVGGTKVAANGTLTWKGDEEGSSTIPFFILGLLVIVGIGGGLYLRARRGRNEADSGDGDSGSGDSGDSEGGEPATS